MSVGSVKGLLMEYGGMLKRYVYQLVTLGNDITNIDPCSRTENDCVRIKIETIDDYEVVAKYWLLPDKLRCFPSVGQVLPVVGMKSSSKQARHVYKTRSGLNRKYLY